MRFVLVFLFYLSINTLHSQYNSTSLKNLIATKNKRQQSYKIGKSVHVKFINDNDEIKCRGKIIGLEDSFFVVRKVNKDTDSIALANIVSVKLIKPTRRKIYGIIGATLTVGGVIAYDQVQKTNKNSLAPVIFIPVVVSGVALLLHVVETLVVEKINEKSKPKGWVFSIK